MLRCPTCLEPVLEKHPDLADDEVYCEGCSYVIKRDEVATTKDVRREIDRLENILEEIKES